MPQQHNDNLPAPPVQARKLMLSMVQLFEVGRKLSFSIQTNDDQTRRDLVTGAGMELERIVNRLRMTELPIATRHAPYRDDTAMLLSVAEILECGRDLGYAALIPPDESRITKIAGVVAGLERALRRIWGPMPEPEPLAA
ncbi:hypothetical protein [Roseococcus pinisoli]|uniref:Uncharacterized protein n=1 Tax=Roseococcus pinisoli TaxID=2835040 RepID=A0ABS5QF42_9PROT|nr:hypothetical protein [Roseococcus pinisoli]MBS7812314.1 hypothetical protein [Roseococcus pinisoli]